MKKLKLLPMALMLVLCVGVLAIGIYAIQPTKNTISGTITVNGTNAPVVIKVYEGTNTTSTGTKLAEKEVRAGDEIPLTDALVFNAEGTEENPVNKIEDVEAVVLTLVLSTTSTDMLVVNTPTIQTLGTDTDKEIVALTKKHEKNNGLTGDELDYVRDETTGLACFTAGYDYTITLTFRLAKFLDAQTNFTYTIPLDIWEASAFKASPDYDGGIDGVDYLYFGEFPQTYEQTGTDGFTKITGESYLAYDDTIGEQTTRELYTKNGETNGTRYVKIEKPQKTVYDEEKGVWKLAEEETAKLYKIETIKWNILSQDGYGTQNTSGTLLVCDIIVEQVYFRKNYKKGDGTNGTETSKNYATDIEGKYILDKNNNPIYANNYEYSDLRSYLNDTFYNNAFNNIYKQLIKLTTVDNGVASTGYETNPYASTTPTKDYIFSLSGADLLNTDYGYISTSDATPMRAKAITDYAYSTGINSYFYSQESLELYAQTSCKHTADREGAIQHLMDCESFTQEVAERIYDEGYCPSHWWSRSPFYDSSNYARRVHYRGIMRYSNGVNSGDPGCVPALLLSL